MTIALRGGTATSRCYYRPSHLAPYLDPDNDDDDDENDDHENDNNSNAALSTPKRQGRRTTAAPSSSSSMSRLTATDTRPTKTPNSSLRVQRGRGQQRRLSGSSGRIASAAAHADLDTTDLQQQEEADAGAGFITHRVSSLGSLLRTPPRADDPDHNAGLDDQDVSTSAARRLKRHLTFEKAVEAKQKTATVIVPDWRLRDRLRTVGVGLIVALNVGTDPPDVVRPHPCAKMQCWMDPTKMSRAKAKEVIGERLELQYSHWQLSSTARNKGNTSNSNSNALKYRRALDPTVEDVRNLCQRLRSQSKNERVLLHYNGHGVPRPTDHGEIWVFDRNHTEYIPLAISDLKSWVGTPTIVVLDCNAAGVLIPFFTDHHQQHQHAANPPPPEEHSATATSPGSSFNISATNSGIHNSPQQAPPVQQLSMDEQASRWVRDTIVLCPCSEGEFLPMHPAYPADIFTACLTTPIKMALRWFVNRNPASMVGLNPEAVDAIPGKSNDRKTPLGEINWIFTAVTDSIAWTVLPKPLFQRLFRQDLLVASMFRNFLLADRILRSLNCTPVSFPPLPPGTCHHPLWQAWDLACETMLFQLMQDGILGNHVLVPVKKQSNKTNSINNNGIGSGGDADDQSAADTTAGVESTTDTPAASVVAEQQQPPVTATTTAAASNVSSPFFAEQLTAFEAWLEFSPIHKMKLKLGGPKALETPEQLPVVLQVLLSQNHRIRALGLLRSFLDLGPWAVNLSLSLGIFPYVMKLLQSPEYKSLLVGIWAYILAFDPSCRVDVLKEGALNHFAQHLMWGLNNPSTDVAEAAKERTLAAFVLAAASHEYPAGQAECIRLSLHGNCCALLSSYEQASIVKDNTPIQMEAYTSGILQRLLPRVKDKNVDVRAAVCYTLGALIGAQPRRSGSRVSSIQDMTSPPLQQQFMQPPPQQQATFQPPPGLVPAGLAVPPNVVVPGMGPIPGQLQPAFAPTASGMPNLQLRPQGVESMQPMQSGQPIQLQSGQPMMIQAGGQFWNHPQLNRGQYLQGQPIAATHPVMGNPTGFLVGAGGAIISPPNQPTLMSPQFPQTQLPRADMMIPTVFEDRHRLEYDLTAVDALLEAVGDGSVVVRYECTVALGIAVAKYLDAFVLVAEELSAVGSSDLQVEGSESNLPIPRGLERQDLSRFKAIWKVLRSIQREDPFPRIAHAANNIVSVVHENFLRFKMEIDEVSAPENETDRSRLGGIDEETSSQILGPNNSLLSIPVDGPLNTVSGERGSVSTKTDIRRVSSEVVTGKSGVIASMEESARMNTSARGPAGVRHHLDVTAYAFPKSQFYSWKKSLFDPNFRWLEEDEVEPDPLSPSGAARAYQDHRKSIVQEKGNRLGRRYASLAKPTRKDFEPMLEEEEAAVTAAEEEATIKKQELQLKEKRLLRNEGVTMNSLVTFHPYQDCLMVCGDTDSVSLWQTNTGKRLTKFNNGNPKGSRMSSSCWINEEHSSLFLVGCNDGTVKIWGNLLDFNGERYTKQPKLVSAFHAAPMDIDKEGTGLVTEWQPFSGTLIAGGNSKYLRCWDIEAERVSNKIETNSNVMVSTMTTAWDYDSLGDGPAPQGYQGLGKDIIVAGHRDGSLKIFDIRANGVADEMRGHRGSSRRSKLRYTSYSEHKAWVVKTAFTGYAG